MTYTPGMVWKLLAGYQRRAQGARQRPRDDVLVQRAAPLEEAPWANSSCLWSDIEQAMRALPFQHEKILWMTVCEGESSWRNGIKRYDWRRRVADWWGRAGGDERYGLTPGDVNKINSESIQAMCDFLNTDTINEVSRGIHRAGGGKGATEVDNASIPV